MIITISLVNSHHLTELQGFCSCDESENEVKVTVSQSCPTLCDPVGYTIHGILQARILEWVAFPFPGDLPNPGIKHRSPALQADSLPAESQEKPNKASMHSYFSYERILSCCYS